MPDSVAVIGLGAMGAPIARRLQRAGFDVLGCDRSAQVLEQAAADGLRTTADVADCAAAETILLLVATADQVRAVSNTIADAVRPGSHPRVVVMSTIPAAVVIEISSRLAGVGATVVDAPISGGAVRAEHGKLSVMAGGADDDLRALRPLLSAIATDVFDCGVLGSGATMKIVNNIVGTASTMALAEACRIAVESGLGIDDVARVFDASSGRTYLTGSPGEIPEFFSTVAGDRPRFDALAAIMHKDYTLAVDLARDVPGEYPLVTLLEQFAGAIGDHTYENWHVAGLATPTDGTAR